MEKVSKNVKADFRAASYKAITDYYTSVGNSVEPSVKGLLVYDPDRGLWAEITVVVKDESKFDIAAERSKYADKAAKAAKRAEDAPRAAEEKEEKARVRAEKAAAKASK